MQRLLYSRIVLCLDPRCDLCDAACGDAHQIVRGEAEHGVRGAGGSPNHIILEQVLIDESGHGLQMTHGRHAADGKAGALTHEIGVSLGDRLGEQPPDFLLIHPVGTADKNQDWAVGLASTEDEGFDDLPDLAADRPGSIYSGTGRGGQLDDLQRDAFLLQGTLVPLFGRLG